MVRKQQHLEPALANKIIDEASQMGIKYIYLHMWGEPLMNKNLENIISYAVSKGIPYVMFTSNGTLLTPERSRSLIDAGLHQLTISFIGNSAGNLEYLMKGADYNQVIQNIESFLSIRKSLKIKTPLLNFQTILMDSTAGELKAFYRQWENRVDNIQLNYIGQPSCLSGNFSQELTEFKKSINRKKRIICQAPFNTMTVLADGSVVSSCCEDLNGKFVLGNLAKDSIKKIWRSDQYNSIRRKIRSLCYNEVPICRNCESIFEDIIKFQNAKIKVFKKTELNI